MKRILQVLAQKPSSTGSGIYFQALVKEMKRRGYPQAALAATTQEEVGAWEWDGEVPFYPVVFQRAALPFPIPGMSDRMPYPSTKYRRWARRCTDVGRRPFGGWWIKPSMSFNPTSSYPTTSGCCPPTSRSGTLGFR